jgi:type IV secretion system protein VirB8
MRRSDEPAALSADDEVFAAYMACADAWDEESHAHLTRSRALAWAVASVGIGLSLLLAIALAALVPLKEFSPYVVRVEQSSGVVDVVRPLAPGALSQDEAVTQAQIAQWIIARETYDPADIRTRFDKVRRMSAGKAWEEYRALWTPDAPTNPAILYGRGSKTIAEVTAISFLNPSTAAVRYRLTRTDLVRGEVDRRGFVGIVSFRYTDRPQAMADRWENPLGFQVTAFRADQESGPAPTSPGQAVAANAPQPEAAR